MPPTGTTRVVAGHALELTNLDKVFFPGDRRTKGATKGDVVRYYERVAEVMLPHVAGRPIVLQRFPDGVGEEGFYQKNTPDHVPDWIGRVEIEKADDGVTTYAVIDDAAGLVYFANQGTVTFHTLLARAVAPRRPVEVIFDLDPAGADVAPVQTTAARLRAVLGELGLAPRVKSTGSRGLHVVVDVVDEEVDFDVTRAFAREVAELLTESGEVTLEHRRDRREGRLFLDVLRNAPANHAVAPYSLRPLPTAPVAVPLTWDEALGPDFHPHRVTLANIAERLASTADPWQHAVGTSTTSIVDARAAVRALRSRMR